MKIAVLSYSFLPVIGGAEIFTYHLVQYLSKKSHEVYLYLPYKACKRYKKIASKNSFKIKSIFFMESKLSSYFPLILSFVLWIRQRLFKYDVWQIIGSYPAGYIARGLNKIVPVVLRCYGNDIQKDEDIQYGKRLNPKIENKIKEAVLSMTKLVALTPSVKDCYIEIGAREDKIIEISNGVSLSRFQQSIDRENIRKNLGIQNNQIFLLSVGRYYPFKKGYEYIPEAAKLLFDKGFNIRWLIAGRNLNFLKTIISKYDVEGIVLLKEEMGFEKPPNNEQLLFPSERLLELYKSADVFIMPSVIETFGMVLIEAMAAGLPIITTDAPGCRDVIKHRTTGLLASPKDSKSLAQQIETVLTNHPLREQLLLNAQKSVKKYDWDIIVDKYIFLYKTLLKQEDISA